MGNAPFSIIFGRLLFIVIDPEPAHSLDFVPPTFVLFVASHNDMFDMDSFPFEELLLNLLHSDSKYR